MRTLLVPAASLSLLALAPRATAETLRVDGTATPTSTRCGRADEMPCPSIERALELASSGDVIEVVPSTTYVGFASPPGLTNIRITSATAERVEINRPPPSATGGAPLVSLVGAERWTLERLTVRPPYHDDSPSSGTPAVALYARTSPDHTSVPTRFTTVRDCQVVTTGTPGIVMGGVEDVTIEGNTIEGADGAILALLAGSRIRIENNVIRNSEDVAIYVGGLFRTGFSGMQTYDPAQFTDVVVARNRVFGVQPVADDGTEDVPNALGIGMVDVVGGSIENNGVADVAGIGVVVGLPFLASRTADVSVLHNTVVVRSAGAPDGFPAAPLYLLRATRSYVGYNILGRRDRGPTYVTTEHDLGPNGVQHIKRNAVGTHGDPSLPFALVYNATGTARQVSYPEWQRGPAGRPLDVETIDHPVETLVDLDLATLERALHLLDASPAIGTRMVATHPVAVDIDGEPRDDGMPDIGFDEHRPAGPDAGTGPDAGPDEDGGGPRRPRASVHGGACAARPGAPGSLAPVAALGALAIALRRRARRR